MSLEVLPYSTRSSDHESAQITLPSGSFFIIEATEGKVALIFQTRLCYALFLDFAKARSFRSFSNRVRVIKPVGPGGNVYMAPKKNYLHGWAARWYLRWARKPPALIRIDISGGPSFTWEPIATSLRGERPKLGIILKAFSLERVGDLLDATADEETLDHMGDILAHIERLSEFLGC